jgi:hypothetical protein
LSMVSIINDAVAAAPRASQPGSHPAIRGFGAFPNRPIRLL